MFKEFTNQIYTPEDSTVTVENNLDLSLDGSSKKVIWVDAQNKTLTLAFDSVEVSTYEEISLHIFVQDQMATGGIFTVTIGNYTYTIQREKLIKNKWNHLLFDCSIMTTISSIVFTSLVQYLTVIIDYPGYRKVDFTMDTDVIEALKNHITLNYDVSTSLSAVASSGSTTISLNSTAYINDNSVLEIDDGNGVTEEVKLLTKNGELAEELTNSFPAGSNVTVLCPVRSEDYDDIEPDPICGIIVYDKQTTKQRTMDLMSDGGAKIKTFLGSLGLIIYIDCNSKKKLFQLAREFDYKYGSEFQFLLDGEPVDIYLDNTLFAPELLGNNPRIAYYYKFQPQPYLLENNPKITTLNLKFKSDTYDGKSALDPLEFTDVTS